MYTFGSRTIALSELNGWSAYGCFMYLITEMSDLKRAALGPLPPRIATAVAAETPKNVNDDCPGRLDTPKI